MRRFLFLTFCGGLATLGGHASLSLGLHPDRVVPLIAVAEGCAALAIGAALFVTGMLGLAEAYEKQSQRLAGLLRGRQIPIDDAGSDATSDLIDSPSGLGDSDQRFWRGYLNTAAGLMISLGGLLALVLILGDISYESYSMTVGAGIAGIALPTLLLWARGFVRIRRSHARVTASARRVEAYPERTPEVETELPRRPTRGEIFRSETTSTS